MGKLVLLIAAICAAYVALKGMARIAALRKRDAGQRARQSPSRQTESMLPCAECGINVPSGEAIPGRTRYFCSEEHRHGFDDRVSK